MISAGLTDGGQEIFMATAQGLAIRFSEENVRPMGRAARGVRGVKLKKKGDAVVGAVFLRDNTPHILTLTANGYGKRTELSEYRTQTRGGFGIINCKVTQRNGEVVGVCSVMPKDDLMVITTSGMMVRTKVAGIPVQGRPTQGVKVIAVKDDDERVAALAKVADQDDEG